MQEKIPTLRTDGRYMLNVRVKPGKKGRIQAYGATKEECRADAAAKLEAWQLAQAERSRALPIFPEGSFAAFLYGTWVPHVYPGLRPASRRKYDTIVVQHLLPALAYLPIAGIGYREAKAMRDGLTRKDGPKATRGTLPLPDRQKSEVIYRFREIMGLYRRLRIAETGQAVRDDWSIVEAPAKPEKKARATPAADYLPALYAAAEAHEKGLVFAAFGLMLRRAEIAGLMKKHIDRDRLSVTVSEQMPERGGKNEPTKGKTRILPITAAMLEHLDTLADPNSLYVFTDQKGRPWKPDAISKLIPKIVARAGLTHATPHDLRSYAASDAETVDRASRSTVQEMLGHASPATTAIYINAPQEVKREAFGKLEKRLTKKPTNVEGIPPTTALEG